jgi:hypothetical protein
MAASRSLTEGLAEAGHTLTTAAEDVTRARVFLLMGKGKADPLREEMQRKLKVVAAHLREVARALENEDIGAAINAASWRT